VAFPEVTRNQFQIQRWALETGARRALATVPTWAAIGAVLTEVSSVVTRWALAMAACGATAGVLLWVLAGALTILTMGAMSSALGVAFAAAFGGA
jgi:hypothetical protein